MLENLNFGTPFRIRIYELKNGIPTNDLSDYQFICTATKPGWNEFDMAKYKIKIPESGCFVALEWLVTDEKYKINEAKNPNNYGQTLGLSYSVENNKGLRKYNIDPWLTSKRKNLREGHSDESFYFASPMIKMELE